MQFNRFDLQDEFSGEGNVSIDPQGLTEPGHVHIAHVIATLSYSDDQDNYSDPNTGEKVVEIIDDAYTSFYFYVPGSYGRPSEKNKTVQTSTAEKNTLPKIP